MSLESQIAALVNAANNLTSEVANKMSGIDQKVDQATEAVPGAIHTEMYKTLWVDAINGSNSNEGTRDKPKKTIHAAIEEVPIGGKGIIYLRSNASHQLIGTGVQNRFVSLYGDDADALDPNTFPIIEPQESVANNELYFKGLKVGQGGFIYANRVNFRTGQSSPENSAASMSSFNMSLFDTIGGSGKVVMEHCVIDIFNGPFMHQHTSGTFGYADLLMRNVAVNVKDTSELPVAAGRQYLVDSYQQHPIPFDLFGVSMTLNGAADFASLITANMTNARTNLA